MAFNKNASRLIHTYSIYGTFCFNLVKRNFFLVKNFFAYTKNYSEQFSCVYHGAIEFKASRVSFYDIVYTSCFCILILWKMIANTMRKNTHKSKFIWKYSTKSRQNKPRRRGEKASNYNNKKGTFILYIFLFCLLDEWFLQNQMDCPHGFCRTSAHTEFCYPSLSYPNNREYWPETRLTHDKIGIFIRWFHIDIRSTKKKLRWFSASNSASYPTFQTI